MFCAKCKKEFPFECTCTDKAERLAAISGVVAFKLPDGRLVTPAPVQVKKVNKD